MNPGVAIIITPKLDLNTLLPLGRELLGYALAKAADGATLSEIAHQLACISAFKDEYTPPTVRAAIPYLNLFHVGFFVAADERDMVEILETAGMPFTLKETLARGIDAAIISGSLAQWRDAVKLACHPKTQLSRGARYAFNVVYKILCKEGLKEIFNDLQVSEQQDHTFLLEER